MQKPKDTMMKQSKISTTPPPAPRKPLDPKQFPANAQTEATAGRDKVREVTHVHAPRQSKRPVERKAKSQTGT